jgi:hypothetical protein
MPVSHLFEADRERGTDDPIDITLSPALSHQLTPRDQDRSQVSEEPVMVAYPMKGRSGEDCINRVVVAEELGVKDQQVGLKEPDFRSPRLKAPACLLQHRTRCVEGYDPPVR